jgi:MFS transporter, DHA2 family, multidrug resistance protein
MRCQILTAGIVGGPRGVETMAPMLVVGRLVGSLETRVLSQSGLL